MAKPNFTLPNKPAIKSDSILSYNYTDDFTFVPAPLTFSRDSAATRVNEKGLIEDVGYFGPELVQNGNFNELGPELVVNGDFSISGGAGVTKWSGYNNVWHIQGGKADCDGNTSFTNSVPNPIQAEESYRTEMTISNYQSGAVAVRTGGGMSSDEFSRSNGTHVFYGVSGNYNSQVYLDPLPSFKGSVDNVSVKSLNPNHYWNLQNPILTQIKADGLHFINAGFTPCSQNNIFTAGKKYRITVNLSLTSGSFKLPHQNGVSSGSATVSTPVTNATYQYDITAVAPPSPYTADRMSFWGDNSCNAVIHSMSVVEILGGKPRIDYTDSLTSPSFLLEPQSTNLITYSEDFSLLDERNNAVVTNNVTVSPSGLLNADEITFDGTSYGRVQTSFSSTNGQSYTMSVYLKNKDLSDVTQVWIGFSASGQGQFVTITDEWQRYDVTSVANGIIEYPRVQFSGTGSLYAWGFQAEELSYATSYIPTAGSTATRLGETATNAGDVNVFNSEEGVLYVEIAALENGNIDRKIIINDGSFNNQIIFGFSRFTGNINAEAHSGGSQSSTGWGATGITQTNYNKFAICWGNGIMKTYVNGAITSTESNIISPTILNNLDFSYTNNTQIMYGKVKNLKVFNKALTDRELEILTIQ